MLPSGVSGKEETVEHLMDTRVQRLDLNSTVRQCAKKMAEMKADSLVLVADGQAVGIITERDLVIKVLADGLNPDKVLARDIMSTPLITISPKATMTEAAKRMSEYKIRRLVVLDKQGDLIGMATADDLAKVLARRKDYSDLALNVMGRVNETPDRGPYQ